MSIADMAFQAATQDVMAAKDKRIAELEAALRESELILTAFAMSRGRAMVCSDDKLTAALKVARDCLR